jgi:hypothetical protein
MGLISFQCEFGYEKEADYVLTRQMIVEHLMACHLAA